MHIIREPDSHCVAREIMGKNFFGMAEVTEMCGTFGDGMLETFFRTVPFSERMLSARRETHVLVPDIGRSIISLGRTRPGLLCDFDRAWYSADHFANFTENPRWRLIRKTPMPFSEGEAWGEQSAAIGDDTEVPHARQVVYASAFMFFVRFERLFEECAVRALGEHAGGSRVQVGSGITGVHIDNRDDDVASDGIGLAIAQKVA